MNQAVRVVLSLCAGYLLGTLRLGVWLSRLAPRAVPRAIPRATPPATPHGAGRRGHQAGAAPAALSGLPLVVGIAVDATKGAAALLLSRCLIGLPENLLAAPAAAAMVGHFLPAWERQPVGGERVAGKAAIPAIGICLSFISVEVAAGRFDPYSLGALIVVASLAYASSRSPQVTGMVLSLFALVITPIELGLAAPPFAAEPSWLATPYATAAYATAAAALALGAFTHAAAKGGVFALRREAELRIWRLIARPFALLFIPIDLMWGRRTLLLVIGPVALGFIAIDLFRIASRQRIDRMYKIAEARRFSSMTFFLVAAFIGFLVLTGEVPYLPLAFTTVGDLFGKLIGLRFGKTRIYKDKTLEGTLGFLAGSLMTGWILFRLIPMPLAFVLAGAPFAALVELFSELLDDNFSVSLLSGGFLAALRFFLGI